MFKCQKCNSHSNPGEKQNSVTVSSRPKVYTNEVRDGEFKKKTITTQGSEIVKEIKVCGRCRV